MASCDLAQIKDFVFSKQPRKVSTANQFLPIIEVATFRIFASTTTTFPRNYWPPQTLVATINSLVSKATLAKQLTFSEQQISSKGAMAWSNWRLTDRLHQLKILSTLPLVISQMTLAANHFLHSLPSSISPMSLDLVSARVDLRTLRVAPVSLTLELLTTLPLWSLSLLMLASGLQLTASV